MGPRDAFLTGLRRSFDVSGRASRSEFWTFVPMAVFLAFAVTIAFDWLVDEVLPSGFARRFGNKTNLVLLAFLHLPVVTAVIRRMNDLSPIEAPARPRPARFLGALPTGWRLSFWLALVAAANLIGFAVAIASGLMSPYGNQIQIIWSVRLLFAASCGLLFALELARPSQPGPNRYGPNPLEVTP